MGVVTTEFRDSEPFNVISSLRGFQSLEKQAILRSEMISVENDVAKKVFEMRNFYLRAWIVEDPQRIAGA